MDNLIKCLIGLMIVFVFSAIVAFFRYKAHVKQNISIDRAKQLKKKWLIMIISCFAIIFVVLLFFRPLIFSNYWILYILFLILAIAYTPIFMYVALTKYINDKEDK